MSKPAKTLDEALEATRHEQAAFDAQLERIIHDTLQATQEATGWSPRTIRGKAAVYVKNWDRA